MQKPISIDSLVRLLSILKVPHKLIPATIADLSFAVFLVFFRQWHNLFFSSWKFFTHLLEDLWILEVKRVNVRKVLWSCRLAHPITVNQKNVQRKEVLTNFWVHRCCSEKEIFTLVQTQSFLHVVENQSLCQFVTQTCLLVHVFIDSALRTELLRPVC